MSDPGITITAADIVNRLHTRYPEPKWECGAEVGDSTGFGKRRALDFLALNTWPSAGFHSVGVEVKVARSDWLRELGAPEKRAEFELSLQEFWVAVPPGVVKVEELPTGMGLLEAIKGGKLRAKVRAKFHRDRRPDEHMWLAILRANGNRRREVEKQCEGFAELAGKPISLDQIKRLRQTYARRGGASVDDARRDREQRTRLADQSRVWRNRWETAIGELAQIAEGEGLDVRAWKAFESPEAAEQITEWLRSHRDALKPARAARQFVDLVDKHLRPLLNGGE